MRTLSQKARILDLLLKAQKKGKKVHMRELNAIAYRYGGRLKELRDAGYKVETIQLGVGEFAYELR